MTRKLTRIFVLSICAMLAGCGAQGEAYQPMPPPATKSLIYVYRPYKFLSSQAIPMVTCGHESIELEPGGYYAFEEDPGQVTCAVADSKTEYRFEARAGERYFIKEEVDASAAGSYARLLPMDPDVAGDQIRECSRQGIKN
jgi:hypothetical protein